MILRDEETEQHIYQLIGLELEDELTTALVEFMKFNQILHLDYLFKWNPFESVIFDQTVGVVYSFKAFLFFSPSDHLQVVHVLWINYWVRKFHVDINKCSALFTQYVEALFAEG